MTDPITKDDIETKLAQSNYELNLSNKSISSMEGFELFDGTSLKKLNAFGNPSLTSLDVTGLTSLTNLYVSPLTAEQITGEEGLTLQGKDF